MSAPFAIYLHLPWCVKKCPYCDFNSYAVDGAELKREADYVHGLLTELQNAAQATAWRGRGVSTVFFGGGTPSLFSGASIAQILNEIRRLFGFEPEVEITLEANPGTVQEQLGREKLKAFREAGINRLSFGAQSFSAEKLQTLGRIHQAADTPRAVEAAREAGFENINLDLIFGVKGETLAAWESDVEQALALNPQHVSLYSLTIEPGTAFARELRRGHCFKLSDEAQAEFYQRTQELLTAAGFRQYEISNFARPSLECAHNLAYWRGRDYLGLGAGAHGFLGSLKPARRSANVPGPEDYLRRVAETGSGEQRVEKLTREQEQIEFFFLRLRMADGFSGAEFAAQFGEPLSSALQARLRELIADGMLQAAEGRYFLTPAGFRFADAITGELIEQL